MYIDYIIVIISLLFSAFFDNKVVKYAKNLKPSKRGEIEIVDLLNKYLNKKQKTIVFLMKKGLY